MEYVRRKRRRSRTTRQPSGGGAGKVIMALLVAGAVIYVISASAAGTWIAENVVAPIFKVFENGTSDTDPVNSPDSSNLVLDPTSGELVTQEVSLPAMTCYALQMGVYSSQNNADTQAQALKTRGAGGYILEDTGKYRVLAAAYSDEASLKSVREQLTQEGLECASYVLTAPSSALRITATQSQLDSLSAGINALADLEKQMASCVLSFDKEQTSIEQGKSLIEELLNKLKNSYATFSAQATTDNQILSEIKSCFSDCITSLDELYQFDTQTIVDFSSKMKYTHLYIADHYADLAQKISSMN